MKKLTLSIIICIVFIGFVSFTMAKSDNVVSKNVQAVNNVLHKTACLLTKNENMNVIGTLISMPGGGVRQLGLDFQIAGPLSKEKIRQILIGSIQDFLEIVNQDEEISPYLKNPPFQIENIEITLFLNDKKGIGLVDPYIGIAGISNGILTYQTLVRIDDIPSLKKQFEETYEEALEALKNQD